MARQLRVLAGQTVAITGGARGIGRATAGVLAGAGMRVAIGDLDLDAARQAAVEIGPSAVALPLDVTDRASFTAFLDGAEQQIGPLEVLINNAGIMQLGRFVDEDDATSQRMIDINLGGVILGTKLALARMVPRNRGHIVNISSQAGKYGAPGGATYSATKHAVIGLTEAVRGELRLMKADIDVSYVMPFVVNTELGSGLGQARGMRSLQPSDVADAILDALQRRVVDVWVPKSARATQTFGSLLPRRVSEAIARAMKADMVLAGADASVRQGYEVRAAASEPRLTGGDSQPAELGSGTSTP
ncbi:MAG TPA: SDR family oxidoreductase [Solirubrobacteraceae bacterium]|jgi:NADP-dependent 3-hydroxy acid dehydrogenase YdfG|nr:SDR family oxidoreductase [Solirubrobacteraceae bacterium]